MRMVNQALIALAALAFLLAIVGTLMETTILGAPPEALSRTCTNLALLAIASCLCCNGKNAS